MIEAAQQRLRQAQFFHRRLLEVGRSKWNNEPEAFRHFFSAFIQSARTVPWVVRKEEKEKYDAWLPTWEKKLNAGDRKLLQLTKNLRNEEVKEGGREPKLEWEEVAFNELIGIQYYDGSHPAYYTQTQPQGQPMQQRLESPGAPTPVKVSRPKYYFENEGDRAEAMTVCKEYLDYLKKFVDDFLSAHGPQDQQRGEVM